MSLSTTYAFDPGASYQSTDLNPVATAYQESTPGLITPAAGLTRRQLQITTTITPTITRGANTAAVPTRTEPRGRPVASAAATSSAESDDSPFPSNLSWWQILGIAVAGVVLFGIVAYIVISRRNKAKLAAVKAKELEVEEGRKAKDIDDIMPRGMGMGMGGMGMGGLGMGMGMGMGGLPMMYGQNGVDGVGGGRRGRGRGKKNKNKKRYDSSDSDSESYDDVSDGGTIKRSRRRRPRRRKDDYSSDETLSSAASSSYYARPTKGTKGRHRDEKQDSRHRDRRRQESTKTPTSRDDDYPLGLGPPTTSLPTGSTRKSPGRKGSMKRFQDSVFSTFDSMTNKAAKLEALKKRAIEATLLENRMQLEDGLRREQELDKINQAKIKEANDKIRSAVRIEKAEEEKARQNMIPLYPTPIPPMRQETYESQTPLIPPAPRSRSNDSGYHSSGRQPSKTRHVGRQQRLAENLAPASAYNSALPDFQNKKPFKSSQKRSSSDLPYAYDGVTSVMSSQPPPAVDTRRPPELEGRKKTSRTPKPPAHRQDSDQPLKSAMRAPGDRKPRRKATITEKPPTTRMITNRSAYDSGDQDDWLPKPPVISKARAPRQSISDASSRGESVVLDVPHPSKRPIIPRGELAPAPPTRAFVRSRTDSNHRPSVDRQETVGGAAGVGAGRRAGGGDQQGQSQWRGWNGSGGMGNVDVTLPSQSKRLNPDPPRRVESSDSRPAMSRAGTSIASDPNQPGKKWANRLRDRK